MKDHLPVLMVLLPLVGGWLTWGIAFLSYRLSRLFTYAIFLLTFYCVWSAIPKVLSNGLWHYSIAGWAPPWGIELVVTPFSAFLACAILLIGVLAYFYLGSFGLIAGLLKNRESLGGSLLLLLVSRGVPFPVFRHWYDAFGRHFGPIF
jgi:multicomponent Na+:H+ antiporter subunit D